MIDSSYELESCTDTLEKSVTSALIGAKAIELCSHLQLGGLTPSTALIHEVIKSTSIPIKIMIRLRGGDFGYNQSEVAEMIHKINELKAFNIGGFVFGATRKDDTTKKVKLDLGVIYQLCKAAYPVPVTIHKAIDECHDLIAEVVELESISNVHFILTSGGKKTALEGAKNLKAMQRAATKIKIIGAGKITQNNIEKIHQIADLDYYHGRNIV